MKSVLNLKNWLIVKTFVIITILIPIAIMAYEFLVLGNESVVFLKNYPSVIEIIIVIYYTTLLVYGAIWLVLQLKSVLSLKNELKKNELIHLQSQVNPHFFFNMLNNLYGMVDKDVEKSKNIILKLSDLMRYSIYEGEKSTVSLSEEVHYLKNYIALHKMRYYKEIDVQFKTDIADDNIEIMPLLLIILLENAFKHGVEKLRQKAYISLYLKSYEQSIFFEVQNNFDENEIPEQNGIGLKNLKRRLELAYPKKHKLTIESNNSTYKAQLFIML